MTAKTTLTVTLAAVTFLTATIVPTLPIPYTAQAQSPPGTSPPPGSLNALSNKWWQFVMSINTPPQINPFTTVFTGDCSFLTQPGNKLFLVGTLGGFLDHGTCNVPAGTSILFPLIDAVSTEPANVVISNPAIGQPFKLLRDPLDPFKSATNLVATLDGRQLQSTFVESTPGGFDITVAPSNPFGNTPIGPAQHAVAEGFWVLLPPLSSGHHTIRFGGCVPTYNFCTGSEYGITVR